MESKSIGWWNVKEISVRSMLLKLEINRPISFGAYTGEYMRCFNNMNKNYHIYILFCGHIKRAYPATG